MFKAVVAASLLAYGVRAENASETGCLDATAEDWKECYDNIQWAKGEGATAHPNWYPAGVTRTDTDMQCALYLKYGHGAVGNSHSCNKRPCSKISESLASEGGPAIVKCTKEAVTAPEPSMKWWGWALIAVAVVGLAVLAAWALGLFGAKKPKKKRAARTLEQAPDPVETSMAPVVTYEVAPPVYTYTAPPVVTSVAAPVYMESSSFVATGPATQCVCGNFFMEDSLFCRKCGAKRPGM